MMPVAVNQGLFGSSTRSSCALGSPLSVRKQLGMVVNQLGLSQNQRLFPHGWCFYFISSFFFLPTEGCAKSGRRGGGHGRHGGVQGVAGEGAAAADDGALLRGGALRLELSGWSCLCALRFALCARAARGEMRFSWRIHCLNEGRANVGRGWSG